MRCLLNGTKSGIAVVIVQIAAIGLSISLPRQARGADAPKGRDFYQVLDDVLDDFEYDLKNGNVTGLKDLSIHDIAVSENVPPSFKNHLELLVTEKILKNSKTRVIQCVACRSKRTQLDGNKVVVSSPDSNPAELSRIAKENGILHFMDVAFAYSSTGMLLSLHITDPDQNTVIWSKTYNSETSRTAAVRRGVDYTQVDDTRKQTEYAPGVQYRVSILYLSEPNVGTRTGTLGVAFRGVERYDNRKKEVGFEINVQRDASSIVGSNNNSTDLYSGLNVSMLFVHAWNFIGEEENYNRPRMSLMVGLGGTYASGFLGALVRTELEWRLGKSYAVTPVLGFRPSSTAFISSSPVGSVSGLEAGLGVSLFF